MPGETPYSEATNELHQGNQTRYSALETTPQQDPALEQKRQAAIKILKEGDFPLQFFADRAGLVNTPPFESEEEHAQRIPQWLALKHKVKYKPARFDVLYDVTNPDNPINGVIINALPEKQARLWEALHTGTLRPPSNEIIHVAPILPKSNGQGLRIYSLNKPQNTWQTTRVYSRYCGLSLNTIIDNMYREPDIDTQREAKRQLLLSTLTEKQHHLTEMLEQIEEVPNPQTHPGNLTVEFIDKQYYQEQLASGATINTLPYNKEHWSFNPEVFMASPEKWEAVVRVIDFEDQALMTRTPPTKNATPTPVYSTTTTPT